MQKTTIATKKKPSTSNPPKRGCFLESVSELHQKQTPNTGFVALVDFENLQPLHWDSTGTSVRSSSAPLASRASKAWRSPLGRRHLGCRRYPQEVIFFGFGFLMDKLFAVGCSNALYRRFHILSIFEGYQKNQPRRQGFPGLCCHVGLLCLPEARKI